MRVCFNRRAIKPIIVIVLAIVAVILVLKLVSLWDSKRGAVDVDKFQSTVPAETETQSPDVLVREPTDEEREELANGNITKDELIQNLVYDAVVTLPDSTTNNGESEHPPGTDQEETHQTEKPAKSEYGQRIAEIIAEVYVLRDEYIIALEHMYSEAEASLTELVEAENKEGMAALVSSYLSRANELEVQCDEKIDAIVAEMKGLIEDNGGDMTPVDTIIETYINEKATKKAWYIERLKEKGLIS